ncbi:MAG: Molybdate-binding periplasmic protein precursor [Pelotomaculum sp. PtaB.Bin013]|uniref:Molybdate ABC transporter substrate-binding protein n=1 Tax=Pelotomaculum isophthalicicum JI TaxID=947010 RepID=A0A9X4GZK5_9FIRM|nr:molybdate ABC transporter substrate-binding protein [Pelotomaculum isophthalicicum]MDF9408902.1 molybdate ABC transporter substrate-binding protein [Pelotomaculum isophthalicicum JI]OPX86839.1 MAG: Molybdate-binding periplasmic protein precursor [Pelotomaculum sp. PtaB.Bin013]
MRRWQVFLGVVFFSLAVLTGCTGGKEQTPAKAEPVNLVVSAAASLKDAMEELKNVYAAQRPNVNISYNFAASGTLQKQIEEGAPVDIFISAGKPQMSNLDQRGLIVHNSVKDLLGNELVLIAPKDSSLSSIEGLTGGSVARISIGIPETVPAGEYAREALTTLNLWDKLQAKILLAKDVRQVITYVETDNVDAGFVYRSDAVAGKNIKIIAAVPSGLHKNIVYPVAILNSSKHQKEAEEFVNYLQSEEASQVFEKYCFKKLRNDSRV